MRTRRLFLLPVALLLAATAAHADTIRLRADVWCPFNCDPSSPEPGYFIEIAKAALEPAGHKIEYVALNWARAIASTRAGSYDGIVGSGKADARDFVFPDNELGVANNCFWVLPNETWTYSGLPSLNGMSFGVINVYSYGEEIDAYIKANEKDSKKVDVVSGENSLEINLKKLHAGRIKAVLEEESVVKSYLFRKKLSPDLVKKAGQCIHDNARQLYVAFSPKLPKAKEYAQLISDKVAEMRKDGSLKTLLAKYGLTDWRK